MITTDMAMSHQLAPLEIGKFYLVHCGQDNNFEYKGYSFTRFNPTPYTLIRKRAHFCLKNNLYQRIEIVKK